MRNSQPRENRPAEIAHRLAGLLVLVALVPLAGCERAAGPALDRGTFYVAISETIEDLPTETNISERLIGTRLLHHGFRLVERPEQARYRLEGKLECFYYQDLKFDFMGAGQHLEHQFLAEADLTLTDSQQRDAEGQPRAVRFQLPPPGEEPIINGRQDMALARRDIRRLLATTLSRRITTCELLVNARAQGLLDALGDPYEQRTFNQVVDQMVALGTPMVPYLLQALEDDRPVRLTGHYRGLDETNRESLRIFHVADMALSDLLERYSGLEITDTEEMLFRVQASWTWVWEDLQGIPDQYRLRANERKDTVKALPPGERSPEEELLTPAQLAPIETRPAAESSD